jgi:hypothetical protein
MLNRFSPIFVLVKHNDVDDDFHIYEDEGNDLVHNQLIHNEDVELSQVWVYRVYPKMKNYSLEIDLIKYTVTGIEA